MTEITFDQDLSGHVVEFWRLPSGVRTGIVANLPRERCIARVSHRLRGDALGTAWTAYNADGDRVVLSIDEITDDLGPAQAAWGAW